MTNLYEDDIKNIYDHLDDPVEKVDKKDDLRKIVITNHKDFVADDCLTIVHKDHENIINNKCIIISSYFDIPTIEKADELIIINILSTIDINQYKEYLEYWINNLLQDDGTVYIQDICLDNIIQFFFTPNEVNGKNVTIEMMKMGISSMYSKEFERKSIITPPIIANILNEFGFSNVEMQKRGIMALIRGMKNKK